MAERDDLIGLRFEIGGGFGKTSGRIVGKAGDLYLVEREGDSHMELASLDDLVSAKFFPSAEQTKPAPTQGRSPLRHRIGRRDDELP